MGVSGPRYVKTVIQESWIHLYYRWAPSRSLQMADNKWVTETAFLFTPRTEVITPCLQLVQGKPFMRCVITYYSIWPGSPWFNLRLFVEWS